MSRNRVRTASLLVTALLLSTIAPGVVAGQETATLTVTVVDGNDDPVGEIDLTATWENGSVDERTAANGKAFVDVPEDANVTITVEDANYVRNTPYEVTNASTSDVEIPVARIGTATIDVVEGNGPVPNAIVQMRKDGKLAVNTRTDGDGTLTTDAIEQGEYRVSVWKEGYLRNVTEFTVAGDNSTQVRIRQGSRLLRVNVTDDHFSPPKPVAEATVTVAGVGQVTTLSNGENTIQVPVNDNHEVSVTKDGYDTNATTIRVGEAAVTANLTIQRTDGVSIDPANERVVVGETVRVTVTDEYGESVADAEVTIDGESVGQTDGQGVLSVPIESAGEHTLAAASGALEASATVEGVEASGDEPSEPSEEPEDTESPEPTDTDPATPENEPTASPLPPTTDGVGPGFTIVGALVACLVAGLLRRP